MVTLTHEVLSTEHFGYRVKCVKHSERWHNEFEQKDYRAKYSKICKFSYSHSMSQTKSDSNMDFRTTMIFIRRNEINVFLLFLPSSNKFASQHNFNGWKVLFESDWNKKLSFWIREKIMLVSYCPVSWNDIIIILYLFRRIDQGCVGLKKQVFDSLCFHNFVVT